MMLPNLIVIGANKCGTTSLHYYLSLHPEIAMSKEKELEYFIEESNWSKGLEWYASHFLRSAKICGESSSRYTNYPFFADVPSRMHDILPDTKLIYLVRDPIERMIAQYVHWYSEGTENRSAEDALSSLDSPYLFRSLYHTQLAQYLEYYPLSQILIISTEDLLFQRRATLRRVFAFLDVDSNFYRRRYAIRRHTGARKRRKTELGARIAQAAPLKLLSRLPIRTRWPIEDLIYWPFSRKLERPKISDLLRKDLAKRLQNDVTKLRSLTGYALENWSL